MIRRVFSYQLWRLLNSQIPLRHPYTRLLQQEYVHAPRKKQGRDWLFFLVIAIFSAWVITSSNWLDIALVTIGYALVLGMLGGGNIIGVLLIIHTIALINAEHRKQRDRLIIITPLGYFGMMTSILHIALNRPRGVRRTIFGLLDLSMFISLYYLAISIPLGLATGSLDPVYLAGILFGSVMAFRFETIQSIILAGIMGVSANSQNLSDRTSAQLMTVSLYFFLQLLIYGLFGAISFLLFQTFSNNNIFNFSALGVGCLAVLFSLREGLIYALFQRIRHNYGENTVNLANPYNIF